MHGSFLTTTLIHPSNASIHATALRVCTINVSVCGCVSNSAPSFSVASVVVEFVDVVVESVIVSVSDSNPLFSVAAVGTIVVVSSNPLFIIATVDVDVGISFSNFLLFVASVGEVFVVDAVVVVVLAAMGVLVVVAININLLVYFSTLSVDCTLPTTSLSTSSISLT